MAYSRHNSEPLVGTGPQRRPLTGPPSSAGAFAAAVRPPVSVKGPGPTPRASVGHAGAKGPSDKATDAQALAKNEMGKGLAAAKEVQGAIRELAKGIAQQTYGATPKLFADTFPQPGAQSPLIAGAAGLAMISANQVANPLIATLAFAGQAVPPLKMSAADRGALYKDVSAATGNAFTPKQVEIMLTEDATKWGPDLQELAATQAGIERRVADTEEALEAKTDGRATLDYVMKERDVTAREVLARDGIDHPKIMFALNLKPEDIALNADDNGLQPADIKRIAEMSGDPMLTKYLDTAPAEPSQVLVAAVHRHLEVGAPRMFH
jgi:hypothetical protein